VICGNKIEVLIHEPFSWQASERKETHLIETRWKVAIERLAVAIEHGNIPANIHADPGCDNRLEFNKRAQSLAETIASTET